MDTIMEHAAVVGIAALCVVLGIARATLYRRKQAASATPLDVPAVPMSGRSPVAVFGHGAEGATKPRTERLLGTDGDAARSTLAVVAPAPVAMRSSPRALSNEDRRVVLDELRSPRFVDLSPAEVYATLLDEGRYLASVRTMYRILHDNREVRERRDQLRHPHYAAPELLATGPNQVWTWDITKLRGPVKCSYYHLYVILDVYSRYVVGWMVAIHESDVLAERLIDETCRRHAIKPGQLTIHADRGSSMKSNAVALLLSDLGVTKTHSRPHVSNDNPFSESNFKTLKYRPDFPDRFSSLEHARAHSVDFFDWYNNDHHHVGIALLTPHDVHHGLAEERLARRRDVLAAAYAAHPERFVHSPPVPAALPAAVGINMKKEVVEKQQAQA
jgi:putative transposase